MKIRIDLDGKISVIDSGYVLPNWERDTNGVWEFTFVNYKLDTLIVDSIPPKTQCDEYYAFDKTINARYGFRQSSKDKLTKIIILYKDSCVRTYTFCYGEDLFRRAQLWRINQWNSEDTVIAYSHELAYYNDAGNRGNLLKPTVNCTISANEASNDQPEKGIPPKLQNRFMRDLLTPSLLSSNSTWNIGLNGGADIGLFPAFPLKHFRWTIL